MNRATEKVRCRAFVLAVAVAVFATAMWTAGAAARDLQLEDSDVITYEHRDSLDSSKRIIRDGIRLPGGGCRFEIRGHIRPGQGLRERELAYDRASCRSLREVATLPAGGLAAGLEGIGAVSTHDGARVKSGLKALANQNAALAETLTLGRFSAFLRTFYKDPFAIEVTSDYVGIEWSPDGVCANPPGESSSHSYEVSWFSPSDWTLESDLFLYDGNCDEVYSNEVAHFKNTLFCVPIISTYISNHTNQIKGYPDATGEYLSVSEKAGDCADLLSVTVEYGAGPA